MVKFESFDDVLSHVGSIGRYQVAFVIVFQLSLFTFCGNYLFMPLATAQPDLVLCHLPNHTTVPYDPLNKKRFCSLYDSHQCKDLEWKSEIYTIIEEWELICGRDYIPQTLNSIQMGGAITAGLFAGQLSDLYGRKFVFMIAYLLMILIGLVSPISKSVWTLAAFRYFIGGTLQTCQSVSLVWGMEATDAGHSIIINISQLWHFAFMIGSGIGYSTSDWRTFSIIINLCAVPFFIAYSQFFYESPRWMVQKFQFSRAAEVLNKIRLHNNGNGSSKAVIMPHDLRSLNQQDSKTPKNSKTPVSKCSCLTLFSTKTLRIYTSCLMLMMIGGDVAGTVYIFGASYWPGNVFYKFFLYGAIRIWLPAFIYLMDTKLVWFGRKSLVLFPLTIMTVFFLSVTIGITLHWNPKITFYGCLAGAVICNMYWIAIWQYMIELYPTLIRNTASTTIFTVGTAVSPLMPQLMYLQTYWPALPYLTVNGFCLSSLVLALFVLPETKGMPSPESIEDMDRNLTAYRNARKFRSPPSRPPPSSLSNQHEMKEKLLV